MSYNFHKKQGKNDYDDDIDDDYDEENSESQHEVEEEEDNSVEENSKNEINFNINLNKEHKEEIKIKEKKKQTIKKQIIKDIKDIDFVTEEIKIKKEIEYVQNLNFTPKVTECLSMSFERSKIIKMTQFKGNSKYGLKEQEIKHNCYEINFERSKLGLDDLDDVNTLFKVF
jgi:hypothetical protein